MIMTCKDCVCFKRCVVLGVKLDIEHDKEADKNCRHFKEENKWIDVKERLPEEDTRVLVVLSQEAAMTYTKMDTDRINDGKWVRWNNRITHWMPLPEPPKVGEDR